MPRYDKYGPQDDRTLEDLDLGFTGYNNRLRPDQLTRGLLRSSVNGRLDLNGEWQVRKGVENVSAPFTVGGTSLTIPLNLPFTITAAAVSSNVLTITTSTSHGLSADDKVVLEGIRYTSGSNPNKEYSITALGASDGSDTATKFRVPLTTANITYTVSDGIVLTWDAFPADSVNYGSAADYGELSTHLFLPHAGGSVATTLADATNTEVTASCRFSDNSITTDEFVIMSAVANASAFDTSTSESFNMLFPSGETVPLQSSIIQALNKIIIFRKQQRALECTQFFKALDIVSAIISSNVVTIKTVQPHGLSEEDTIGIDGTSGTADINGIKTIKTGGTFDANTFQFDQTAGDETLTITNAQVVPVFQLVQGGDFTQPVAQTLAAKDFAIINSVATAVTTASLSAGDNITLTNPSSTGLAIGTTGTISEVFTASTTTVTVNAVSISGTTVTIGCSSVHGLSLHQPIELKLLDTELNGKQVVSAIDSTSAFKVEVASTFSVSDQDGTVEPSAGASFIVDADSISTVKTQAEQRAATPTFIKRIAQGGGYIHMPFPEYGTYHQKRLVVPHFFNVIGTTTLATTDRKNRDEIIFSDILDINTYDAIFGQFRFNAGTADFNVGLHSFNEDNLLVFNRNSIHLVSNTISLKNSSVRLLTNEVGCISRKSIQQIGSQVLFLSDNGIYAIEFLDVLNLRGNDVPLSEPIKTNIDLINKSIADKATAVYFDNRYYIALPMDLIQGESVEQVFFSEQEALEYIDPATGKGNTFDASDTSKNLVRRVSATGNNVILIYNFLNKQWESIDYIGASADVDSFNIDGNFDILDLIVSGKGNSRAVYAVNSQGGVHRLDSNVNGVDSIISTIGSTTPNSRNINGFATTRMFNLNSIDRKRFNNFELLAESSVDVGSTFRLGGVTENIDKEFLLNNSSAFNITSGEDVALRGRIGNKRAYGMQFRVQNTSGRPKLKGIKVSAAETFRSTNKAE